MDIMIANVDHIEFKIERDLNEQFGALPLPFPGMDKSKAAVCQFFNRNDGSECMQGLSCPFRHIRGDRTIVCKHWLRGLCKKGDQCEFLHQYDMTKMGECYFYSRFNTCHKKECPFLHIDPESKIKDCPWYNYSQLRYHNTIANFRRRHVRRVLCTNYLASFCPDGETCKYMHPRFELPLAPEIPIERVKRPPTCHFCGELGHKAVHCQKMPPEDHKLRNIVKSARSQGAYGCVVCSKQFKYKSHMRIHMRQKQHFQSNMTIDSFQPNENQEQFEQSLKEHIAKGAERACDICSSHLIHKGMQHYMVIHSDERLFQCGICAASFKLKFPLKKHMHLHINQKAYECHVCDEKFSGTNCLKSQQRKEHKDICYSHQCIDCLWSFKDEKSLAEHADRMHFFKYKPFECDLCDRDFKSQGNLNRHKDIHGGKKLSAMCVMQVSRKNTLRSIT